MNPNINHTLDYIMAGALPLHLRRGKNNICLYKIIARSCPYSTSKEKG
jgi:hypothetical protein